jgi:hypothetical protein
MFCRATGRAVIATSQQSRKIMVIRVSISIRASGSATQSVMKAGMTLKAGVER